MTDETTTAAPKTTAEKLAAAKALVAKYEAQIAQEAILNNIEAGDDVTFKFGRGEKVRELAGRVTATRFDEHGSMWAAIKSGEGFEEETYKVRATDIVENRTAAERAPANEGAAGDPLNEA